MKESTQGTFRFAARKPFQRFVFTASVLLLAWWSMDLAKAAMPGSVISWGTQLFPDVAPGTVFTNITTGFYHTLAIRNDGTVAAWGADWIGQCRVPPGLSNVVAVAAGVSHSLALRKDGSVVGWGDISGDQVIPSDLTNCIAISCREWSTTALRKNGTVTTWGSAYGNQSIPGGLNDIAAVAGGGSHHLALRTNGLIVAWGGFNSYGELNVPPSATNVSAISAGLYHSLVLRRDGTVVAWGLNDKGQSTVPVGLSNVVAVSAGNDHSLALKSDGTVVVWGSPFIVTNTPSNLSNLVAVAAGLAGFEPAAVSLALKDDGSYLGWGTDLYGQIGAPPGLENVLAFDSGYGHRAAVRQDGTVLTWGQYLPPGTENLSNMVAISCGGESDESSHILALTSNGNVSVRGGLYNSRGQTNVPADLTNAITVSTRNTRCLALRDDGTVTSWGGDLVNLTNPPAGLSNVVAISSGWEHSLALKNDGTVVAWGYNGSGQTNVPPGLSNVVAIAAGGSHSLALKDNGTVAFWGDYKYYYYGSTPLPTTNPPPGLSNVVAIAAQEDLSLALRSDGTVVAWGTHYNNVTNVPAGLSNIVAITAGYGNVLVQLGDRPPVVEVRCLNPGVSGQQFHVSVLARPGRVYRMEYKNSLSDADWIPLPLMAGRNGTLTLTDPNPINPQRYYRVRHW